MKYGSTKKSDLDKLTLNKFGERMSVCFSSTLECLISAYSDQFIPSTLILNYFIRISWMLTISDFDDTSCLLIRFYSND